MFAFKESGVRKARLVVVGCKDKQQYSNAEKAASTPAPATIRWFFALAASKIGQCDRRTLPMPF